MKGGKIEIIFMRQYAALFKTKYGIHFYHIT